MGAYPVFLNWQFFINQPFSLDINQKYNPLIITCVSLVQKMHLGLCHWNYSGEPSNDSKQFVIGWRRKVVNKLKMDFIVSVTFVTGSEKEVSYVLSHKPQRFALSAL